MSLQFPYEEIFADVVRASGLSPRQLPPGECVSLTNQRCSICYGSRFLYDDELPLKNLALQKFWSNLNLDISLSPLQPSPYGRNYRTVTKRKVFLAGKEVRLGLVQSGKNDERGFEVATCAIEPEYHARIYDQFREVLNQKPFQKLAASLRYVILKGDYAECSLIFHVGRIDAEIVRSANAASKNATKFSPAITSVWLFQGDDNGRYYLGTRNPERGYSFRKLFGRSYISQEVQKRKFRFAPSSFTQVNLSHAPSLVGQAKSLLKLTPSDVFLDLYCGYGLFSLLFADSVKRVTGVELSRESIQAAVANAKRLHIDNCRFITSDISGETVGRVMVKGESPTTVLLDPPRNGTAPGVIETIAAYQPNRVVHIFCNIDIVFSELQRWKRSRFRVISAIPVDMFPGTSTIEIITLLEPSTS
ncbi:MAG TPA: methyltransferase domain-containing protein [Bacteroidota bacterium]